MIVWISAKSHYSLIILIEFCIDFDDFLGIGDDTPENKIDVEDHGDRPAKPNKRRQSEPKPICTINPNVKQGQKVSQKAKKAKSTPAAKETLHLA